MKQLRPWLFLAVLVAVMPGCEQESAPDSPDSTSEGPPSVTTPRDSSSAVAIPMTDSVLTPDGWRNLRIGMTRAEVVAAAGEDANPDAVGGPDPATCDEFRPLRAPQGLLVMIRDGKLSRISISAGTGIVTNHGIAVGDSISAVIDAYGGDAHVTPHAFHEAPDQYLATWQVQPPSSAARGLVYEITDAGRVLRILAGDESIEYREGCV